MDEFIIEEQESFSKKMANIQQTNSLLDELQKKMNNHFESANKERGNPDYHDRTSKPELNYNWGNQDEQNQYIQNNSNHIINHKKNQHLQNRLSNLTHKQFTNGFREDSDSIKMSYAYGNNQEDSQEKYARIIQTENNALKQKRRENFKVFPKTKSQHGSVPIVMHNSQSLPYNQNIGGIKYNTYNSKIPPKPMQHKNLTSSSQNQFVNKLESMQRLMKEKVTSKQNQIRQLQQEILSQNEEKVYLYKVNVRLEEELKFLYDSDLQGKDQNNPMLSFQIKKLQSDISRIKSEIQKKKNERKQLRKQEQTLKDGYKLLIDNCKGMASKQIEKYSINMKNKQGFKKKKQQEDNQIMLRKLMGDLEKLREMVEERIREPNRDQHHSTSYNRKGQRRVIKSFKH